MMSSNSNQRRNVIKMLGAGAVAATGLTSGGAAFSQERSEDFVLASVLPLSGGFAQYGLEIARGIELAVEAVNKKGMRIGGKTYRIQLKTYDDKTDATTAARLTERAATNDGAHIVMAGCGSTIAKSIIPVAQRLRVPMMAQWAQVDGVFVGQKGNPFLFGTMPAFSRMYDNIWPEFNQLKNPQLKTVVMVTPNDELGVFMARDLPATLEKHGLKHLHTEMFPPTSQDFGATLERCSRHNPDIFLINCYTPQIISIFKQMQAVQFFPAGIIVEAPTRLFESIGPGINGAFVPSFWAPTLTGTKDDYIGTSREFSALYQAKHKVAPPDFVAACGAANVMVMAQVAAKAGSITDAKALLDAFRNFDGQTFFSQTKYGDDGLNVKAPIFGAQFQDGKVELVHPTGVRQKNSVHPYPGWKKA